MSEAVSIVCAYSKELQRETQESFGCLGGGLIFIVVAVLSLFYVKTLGTVNTNERASVDKEGRFMRSHFDIIGIPMVAEM